MTDQFAGNNAQLVESIEAVIALDAVGALVPHGLGGGVRQLLESAADRLRATTVPTYYKNQRIDGGWTPPFGMKDCKAIATAVPYQRIAVPFYEAEVKS